MLGASCVRIVRFYQQTMNGFAHVVANTSSLEKCLRIQRKTLTCYSKIYVPSLGIVHISLHIKTTLEVLSAIQTITLLRTLSCPNVQGVYFFKRASWQICGAKIFLLGYSLLANIRLAVKLKIIDPKYLGKSTFGHVPIFRLVTSTFYLLSCAFLAAEGVRVHSTFQVMTAIGKMSVITFTLFLETLHIQTTLYVVAITAFSCMLDVLSLAKQEHLL